MNQPQQQEQPPTLNAVINNAFAMTTGLNNFIQSSKENLEIMSKEIERLKVFETNAPKLKAEIIELKGKLKKGKK